MNYKRIRPFLLIALKLISGQGLIGCRTAPEVAPVINTKTAVPVQAALVSVQPTRSDAAEVVVKLTAAIKPGTWRLTVQPATSSVAPGVVAPVLTPAQTQLLDPFSLATFRLMNLTAGQAYRLRLGFRYNQRDSLTLERTYTHPIYNPWKRLAHLPFDDGLFTGSLIERSAEQTGDVVRLTRYVNDTQWQTNVYSFRTNKWFPDTPPPIPPRRGLIEYNVYFQGTDRHYFYGLGYQTDDLFPGRYVYMRDMYAVLVDTPSLVLPFYQDCTLRRHRWSITVN